MYHLHIQLKLLLRRCGLLPLAALPLRLAELPLRLTELLLRRCGLLPLAALPLRLVLERLTELQVLERLTELQVLERLTELQVLERLTELQVLERLTELQGCRAGHLQLHQSHVYTIRGAHWRQVHRKHVEDDSGAAAFSCVVSCVLLRLRLHRVMNSGRIVPSMSHRDSFFVLHHFLLGLCYSSFTFCCPTLKPKLLVTSQF
ncbi:hypothetical protein ACER0C_031776 [Sarotherodon galilaeus]